jgi:hypothetical protein
MKGSAMKEFITKHGDFISGVISGFDRLVFRGSLRTLSHQEGQRGGAKSWQKMRKGIADLPRRAHLCQAANERYLDALASVSDDQTLAELTKDLCRPVTYQGRRY